MNYSFTTYAKNPNWFIFIYLYFLPRLNSSFPLVLQLPFTGIEFLFYKGFIMRQISFYHINYFKINIKTWFE